ncbi:NLRC3, partial [Symbiodinium sp. KB8]
KSSWEVICIANDEDEHRPTPGPSLRHLSKASPWYLGPQSQARWHAFHHRGPVLSFGGLSFAAGCYEVLGSACSQEVSDTTAARYLRSVQLFFTTFEELGGSLEEVDQGLFLDSFFSLSRSLEDGPLSNSQNVLKALRWYSKLLRLSVLPDLYSPAFSTLASSSAREKRESVPLPLVFHAFLE